MRKFEFENKFDERKEEIKQKIKRLEKELSTIDTEKYNPDNYCPNPYTEEDYFKYSNSGQSTNEELKWLKANIRKKLVHDYQRAGHLEESDFEGSIFYEYEQCRHCGDRYTDTYKR